MSSDLGRILIVMPDHPFRAFGGLGASVGEYLRRVMNQRPELAVDILRVNADEDGDESFCGGRLRVVSVAGEDRPLLSSDPIIMTIDSSARAFEAASDIFPRPDVVHSQDWSGAIAGLRLARRWRVPHIFSVQLSIALMADDLCPDGPPDGQRGSLQYASAIECQAVMDSVETVFLNREDMRRLALPFRRSSVIHHGIDVAEWDATPFRPYKLPGNRPKKLVYIGRLDVMKNVVNLAEAPLPDDVDLVIVGGHRGSHPEVMERVADRTHAGQVHRLEFVSGDDKRNLMRSADFGIFPSIHEPFGLVGLEWMAAGTPLIASFADGMREYLRPGDAIDCGTTPGSIGAAIEIAFRRPESERRAMAERARRHAAEFTWYRTAMKHIELYERTVLA